MVYLSKIYTKTGDDGTTGLVDGTRIPKSHQRIRTLGAVDELNSALGVFIAQVVTGTDVRNGLLTRLADLKLLQNDLFDLGADLATPMTATAKCLRIQPEQVERLETWIDEINERLSPLHSFVLPGGLRTAAQCHLARSICRRAECEVVSLMEVHEINPHVLKYLNRLSDLLFVMARMQNMNGMIDVLWKPAETQKRSDRE